MKNQYKAGLGLFIVLALCIGATGNRYSKIDAGGRENSPEVCGGINFTSQAQIDAFPSTYDCSEIIGDILISGNDITNVDSLARLRSITGTLAIRWNPQLTNLNGLRGITSAGSLEVRANPKLTSLNGLQGITSISTDLQIVGNTNLPNLDGLSGLSSVDGTIFLVDYVGTNIDGLSSLRHVGVIILRFNNQLMNLRGFMGVTSMTGLEINGNNGLTDLTGLAALDSINGDVTITSNTGLTTLNGLASLKKVNNLTISSNTTLSTLNGLSSLQTINGNLLVSGNTQLSSLDGLTTVTTVRGVTVSNNTSLTSLQGLSSLTTTNFPGSLTISQNPSLTRMDFQRLTTIAGSLTIADNTSLTNLNSLSSLQTIGGALTISNVAIANLDSLHLLTKVGGDLFISSNPNLESITGLSSLYYVGKGGTSSFYPGAHITYNPKLTNLEGLNNLTTIAGMLEVSNNATLTNLDGLSSLQSLAAPFPSSQNLIIEKNPALVSLKGLRSITSLSGHVSISNNSALPNLDGLESLTQIVAAGQSEAADLQITGNASLSNIDGLSSLTKVFGHYGSVTISYNPLLLNLNGLSSLKQIGGSPSVNLAISNNASLQNVDGLSSLEVVGSFTYLTLTNNSQLVRCCGLYHALSLIDRADCFCVPHVTISGNGAGCTKDEIIAGCAKCTGGEITLTSQKEIDAFPTLGCTAPSGTVTISGSDITNLDSLHALTSVGKLVIRFNNSLTTLKGLSGLTEVRGDFMIQLNGQLPNLDGLTALKKVGGNLTIDLNSALTNLSGLSALDSVKQQLSITNNNKLANVDGLSGLRSAGSIQVTKNSSLTRCCGLYQVLHNGGAGTVSISGNGAGCTQDDILAGGPCPVVCNGTITLRSQAEVNAFPSTHPCNVIAGSLYVSGDDITNLDSLHFVTKITGLLEVSYNATLTNLDGLSSLQSIGAPSPINNSLIITNNPALISLNGLRSITSLSGNVTITFNSSLPNLHGLESLTKIADVQGDGAWLKITDNASLSNIDGLSALTDVTGKYVGISIVNNPSLLNVNGLSSLRQIAGVTAVLEISSNTSLPNVDGLSSLKTIGSDVSASLVINNNTALTNVDGLSSLTQIRSSNSSLTVTGNTQLARCCGLYNALTDMTSSSCSCNPSITISGNGAGCTKDDILAGGPCCTSPGGCPPPEPTAQPTNLAFTNINSTSMSVSFTAAAPTANGYIALMRPSSSPYPNDTPVDGSVYNVGDVIGNCSVVGFGSGTSFNVTNLSASTAYYFDVYSFNGSNYLTTNPLGGNQRTADLSSGPAQPTNMIFSAVTDTTMTVSFTAATGTPSGYITLMQAFGAPYPDDVPVDGTVYQPGDVIGSSSIVVNVGGETSLDIIYLSPGIDYYFDTFSYTISNGVYDYLTVNPLEGNQRTTSSGSPSARMSSNYMAKSTASSEKILTTSPFPNPFSENITIPFTTEKQNVFVQVVIFDLMGKRIADVVGQSFAPGYHEAKWWGTDNFGSKVSQGIYIYSIRTNESKDEARGLLVAK